MVRGGFTPQNACRHLIQGGFPEGDILLALKEFETMTNRIRTMRDPPSLTPKNRGNSWYIGPGPSDIFWPALKNSLIQNHWDESRINSLDSASTKIVSLLESPNSENYSVKGLVLGYVQSGKTANFTAVIAKAADSGYKFFIVMSGLTDSLRNQTQERLETDLISLKPELWLPLTYPNGDFSPSAFPNPHGILSRSSNQRIICIIKKNPYRLRGLLRWLKKSKDILPACPVLIIDDESDQASINTLSPEKRSSINQLIIDIIKILPKNCYIGYTATPFANVLIDPTVPEDLYPRDFVIDLDKSVEYFGPEQLFGRDPLSHDEPEAKFEGLDMIRKVEDEEVKFLRPKSSQNCQSFVPIITKTLEDAIKYFWMATAARYAKGQHDSHSSMLIHTTLSTIVHERYRTSVISYRADFLNKLLENDAMLIRELKSLWMQELQKVPGEEIQFDQLFPYLQKVVQKTKVIVDNCKSKDRLDYGGGPQVIIVIGGNTLSRGLTIDGLIVSYFVRASTAYDTLLQMGRWFGYRKGYEKLPRIWMTKELRGYFRLLATVEEEIRQDIRRYEVEGISPLDCGVRIRTHPKLSITARAKMQAAIPCYISYNGRRVQTILFHHMDKKWLQKNIDVTRSLIENAIKMKKEIKKLEIGGYLIRDIPVEEILKFINTYNFHENSQEMKPKLLSGYIIEHCSFEELKTWNVYIAGPKNENGRNKMEFLPGIALTLITRSQENALSDEDTASIGVMTSNIDYIADLDSPKRYTDSKIEDLKKIRKEKLPGIGLLVLYPIDKDSKASPNSDNRVDLKAVENIIGVSMIFPESEKDTPQTYMTADLSGIEREIEEEFIEEETDESECAD